VQEVRSDSTTTLQMLLECPSVDLGLQMLCDAVCNWRALEVHAQDVTKIKRRKGGTYICCCLSSSDFTRMRTLICAGL
jgi:hypothetical protein